MRFDPNHLAALSAVLRLGSFDAAAHSLSVTPSAISQRIKALEDRVGATLIQRGPPCTGTEAGLRIAKHAEDVALLERQLSQDLSLEAAQAPARLRLAINADSLATWFIGAMAAVQDLLFDVVIDDQDHSADWLKRGEVSAAVTALGKPIPGCDAVPLGKMRYIATASPAYMRRWFPEGVTPEAARQAPCLIFNAKDALQRRWLDQHVGPGCAPPAHFIPSTQGFAEAALAGMGWGMNPLHLIQDALETGDLVPLLPESALEIELSWQVSRVMAKPLAPVTRSVLRSARKQLLQD